MAEDRKYHKEEWLREKYLEECLSQSEIADMCGVSTTSIQKARDKFGINVEDRNFKYNDEDWLREKYLDEELSYEEISEECSKEASTIERWIRKHNIGNYECGVEVDGGVCGRKFREEAQLKDHQTTVHEHKPLWERDEDELKHHDPEWVQEKLESGVTQKELAEECDVSYNTIRRVTRINNLGIHGCSQDGCEQRYPTEGGLKQHISGDHPKIDYDDFGLDLDHVKDESHKARMEMIEKEVGQYDPEVRDANLEKAKDEYDPERHSKRIQEVWEERDPEDYHQRRDGWWEKYAESREEWGRQTHENEVTGNTLDSK